MEYEYFASSDPEWNYIGIDKEPPSGKIHVLQEGGVSISGDRNTEGMIAWASLMTRDKEKEELLKLHKDDPVALAEAASALKTRRANAKRNEAIYAGVSDAKGNLLFDASIIDEAMLSSQFALESQGPGARYHGVFSGDLNNFCRRVIVAWLYWRSHA